MPFRHAAVMAFAAAAIIARLMPHAAAIIFTPSILRFSLFSLITDAFAADADEPFLFIARAAERCRHFAFTTPSFSSLFRRIFAEYAASCRFAAFAIFRRCHTSRQSCHCLPPFSRFSLSISPPLLIIIFDAPLLFSLFRFFSRQDAIRRYAA
jgi:hypothetical protein